ncbi:P-loop containing nucleoside triphosphate hydrolase protein, partial [Morchella snyderi]
MPRQRAVSGASSASSKSAPEDQELGSMYDYLAKIVLLGPSGCGKSCLLHRFVRGEWRVLSSQTIGVEFSSKIIKVGTGPRRKRIKLQLWDTAGQERFRSVTRSYYRGAAGALLVYDITSHATFASLPTFLTDARALASPNLALLLVGNKNDLSAPPESGAAPEPELVDVGQAPPPPPPPPPPERAVSAGEAARWADRNDVPVAMETSALTGGGVDEVFERLAGIIVTRIELGEVDPDDPMSGIQYGDGGGWVDAGGRRRGGSAGGGSGGSMKGRSALAEWGDVFRDGTGRKKRGCC